MAANGRTLVPALTARNGHKVLVLGIARISTLSQDERSLGAQKELYERWLNEHLDLPWRLKMISTQGSGERLDRCELKRMRKIVRRRKVDLVLAEDLARVMRRVHAQIFCELCEDHDVRFVAINDNIDTAQENWTDQTFFASYRHEKYNADTARRIRRSLRHHFLQGGALRPLIFGYDKKDGATNIKDVYKLDSAQPIYDRWVQMLEEGASYAEASDWTNERMVPLPKTAIARGATRWTGRLIASSAEFVGEFWLG